VSFIPVGYAEVVFHFTCAGIVDPIITTIGVHPDPSITPPNIAQIVSGIWTTGSTPFGPFQASNMSNVYSLVTTSCTLMTSTGPIIGEYATNVTGGSAVSRPPAQVAFLVRKSTARGGRKGRGRMFLPAAVIPEGEIDEAGKLQTATITREQPKLNGVLAQMNTLQVPAVLLHSDPITTPDTITALTLQSIVGSQRRRLR